MSHSSATSGFRTRTTGFPPAPTQTATPTKTETEHETWEERVLAALPLFVVGVACLAVAVEFYTTNAVTALGGNSSVLLRPWVLFLVLGITGVAAGVVTLVLNEEPEPAPTTAPAAVPSVAPQRSTTPAWDESLLEPEPSVPLRRRTWETELSSEGAGAPVAAPADVLQQIEEIEASLRKSARRPPPD